ncbi:benzoyl-CoA reductase subunit BadG [Desulfocucumis palustris]|uniref:Benzoyl-CoA reductase subunit BadG n=1 Tax=Desulfocucumis palustris TaxID=1898651 RepID=A0A2L2XA42_9FIRM|nr:acyl-CoA dehydratase activase [Desulfocucumis palustris]GBF33147.1 benzoyl-CoA reductase subunit BadG [Desulfocucumis palustris]
MGKYFLGVDIGSLTTKVVLLNEAGEIAARATGRSGYGGRDVARRLTAGLLDEKGLAGSDVAVTVATGYGRITYPADREMSEITCQARGIAHLFPGARTVIDIGGQDSKVIRLLPGGKVADFAMNDKCAAGTGRFLEVMAGALEVPLEEIGDLSLQAGNQCDISSFCTVFAESEVISHVSAGAPKADILAGVCNSVAARVASMSSRTGLEPEIVFTGGVARNSGVAASLAKQLGCGLKIPEDPVITAALGAALFARGLA